MLGLATATFWLCTFATCGWSSISKFTKSSGQRGTSGYILKCFTIRLAISGFSVKIRLAVAAMSSRAVSGALSLSFGVGTGSSSSAGANSLVGLPTSWIACGVGIGVAVGFTGGWCLPHYPWSPSLVPIAIEWKALPC